MQSTNMVRLVRYPDNIDVNVRFFEVLYNTPVFYKIAKVDFHVMCPGEVVERFMNLLHDLIHIRLSTHTCHKNVYLSEAELQDDRAICIEHLLYAAREVMENAFNNDALSKDDETSGRVLDWLDAVTESICDVRYDGQLVGDIIHEYLCNIDIRILIPRLFQDCDDPMSSPDECAESCAKRCMDYAFVGPCAKRMKP